MSIYEYECQECGHRFEETQKFDDEDIDTCPECGGKVNRVIQSVVPTIKRKEMLHKGIHIHQTEDGHWEENGMRERATGKKPRYAR